ncbi:ABC transporter permease [Gloeocapsa sp. PCC 73106]|uniref:ABC transporter permease n=1 Tax=Gloeocapsa sp. PCC 73106 TaxID=102232 RepID=UPI0002ACD5FD|nr:ABC transporter permease [Gloeocapsa sp. PCC 73106]ELR97091.1 ABC-type multidrug transport system, permease component [Gloeocapsa sp. PCC 73106]
MKRILAQSYKELTQFYHDPLTLALAFLLPFITVLIYGFGIRLESTNIPMIVQNFDGTNLSNSYVERLYGTNQFLPTAWSLTEPVENALDLGIAKVAVIIPPQFSRNLKTNRTAELQVLIDATDVNNASLIKNTIQNVTSFFLQEHNLIPETNPITPKIRLWFNPGRLESLFFVPGVYGVVLWIYPSILATVFFVREKENGTIVQFFISGLSAYEFLLGKGLAYLLVAISQALVVIGLGILVFQIGIVGNPIILFLGTLFFLANSVLFGILVGVRNNNQNEAVQAVAITGFMTSILLSGFIYPLTNIPFPFSLLSQILPIRYYLNITRDVFIKGIGWGAVWTDLVILIVLGLILFASSFLIFRNSKYDKIN